MSVSVLLDMAADGFGSRVAVGPRHSGLTYVQLQESAARIARCLRSTPANVLGMIAANSAALPQALFAGAAAGVAFAPLNYRLAPDRLAAQLRDLAPVLAVVDGAAAPMMRPFLADQEGIQAMTWGELDKLADAADGTRTQVRSAGEPDPDDVAVLLHTSGTTAAPKVVLLRHRHLVSYIFGTVEFMSADETECALVSVPPYHVAGITAVLSSVYSGRRVVYLDNFDAQAWVSLAQRENVSHAMVVPTMLARILDVLENGNVTLPALRHLSYGAGRMPQPTIERALALLPHTDFVNAYGLTETSSTISVLSPDEHRAAAASSDPEVRERLSSVGRPTPAVELQVRTPDGEVAAEGTLGEIWIRGDQVSGEYRNHGSVVDGHGWFPTRDLGRLRTDGYLFVHGRLDDVIVRGGENIAPVEIEETLLAHPLVADAGVVGVRDDEWGEAVAAAIVARDGASPDPAELQNWVRERLRSSRVPHHVVVVSALPYNDTGKLDRRMLRALFVPGSDPNRSARRTTESPVEGERTCR